MRMNDMAIRYSAMGAINSARPLFESCLQRRRDLGLAAHKDTIGAMYNLANRHSKNNLNDLATPLHEEALSLIRSNPSSDARQVIGVMHNWSISLGEEGGSAQAEASNKEALQVAEDKLGVSSTLTLDTWCNVASKTAENCKHAEAASWNTEADGWTQAHRHTGCYISTGELVQHLPAAV